MAVGRRASRRAFFSLIGGIAVVPAVCPPASEDDREAPIYTNQELAALFEGCFVGPTFFAAIDAAVGQA